MVKAAIKAPSSPSVRVMTSVVLLSSGEHYYIDHGEKTPSPVALPPGMTPTTVVFSRGDLSHDDVMAEIERFRKTDDVFCDDFLALVIVVCVRQQPTSTAATARAIEATMRPGDVQFCYIDPSQDGGSNDIAPETIPEGPYLAGDGSLFPVRKLVPDTQGAFVASVVQDGKTQRISYLTASVPAAHPNLTLAIPSRLYFPPPTAAKPLSGLRFAVKDNIDIAGVKTYASCKSYGNYYGPRPEHAPAVRRLLDLGAVVVGKTGMSQFADGELAMDFFEFLAPANPRGDGNRTTMGSSFGAGASSAAYTWLDFNVGTDTGGSCRKPAGNASVFGLRPSNGRMTLDGTVLLAAEGSGLDAIGLIVRDLEVMRRVATPFYSLPDPLPLSKESPPTLLVPDNLFPVKNPDARKLFGKILLSLEAVLGVERTPINLAQIWKLLNPKIDQDFEEYFGPVCYDLIVWGEYHNRTDFRQGYQERHGCFPLVNNLLRERWADGEDMRAADYQEALRKRDEYERFIDGVFGKNTFMFKPYMSKAPPKRDSYASPEERPDSLWGYRDAFQANMAGQPEVVFPVGQIPVLSDISGVEEKYGAIAALTGSKGMDCHILKLAADTLSLAGLPTAVLTGKVPYKET